jgi:serine/threonine protein kinase
MTILGLGRSSMHRQAAKEEATEEDLSSAPLGPTGRSGLAPVATFRQECTRKIMTSVCEGSLISGFVVEKQIGHGSYGSVYQAASTSSRRRVALKLGGLGLRGEDTSDFQVELELYNKLFRGHPLFLQCYGGGFILGEGSMAWLAIEIADGSLRERLRATTPSSKEDRLAIAVQVGAGLGFMHEQQVCHLDVKTENITWCDRQRKACLCDFGMSETVRSGKLRYDLYCTSFNRPPELWETINEPSLITPAVDAWSFGLVLWETASHHAARFHWGTPQFGDNVWRSVKQYLRAFCTQSNDIAASDEARKAVALRASLAAGPWRQVLFAVCTPDPSRRPKLVPNEAQMLVLVQSWQERHFKWPCRSART